MGEDMFDKSRLKAALPFCQRLDIDTITDPDMRVREVVIHITFQNGLRASVTCPDLPPDTDTLIVVCAAAAHQCFAWKVTKANFRFGGKERTVDLTTAPGPNGYPGRLHGCTPAGAPPVRELKRRFNHMGVIDVDGVAVGKWDKGAPLALPAPPPPTLDREKVQRATKAMSNLMKITEGEKDGQ